jgi:hypothetical protein
MGFFSTGDREEEEEDILRRKRPERRRRGARDVWGLRMYLGLCRMEAVILRRDVCMTERQPWRREK